MTGFIRRFLGGKSGDDTAKASKPKEERKAPKPKSSRASYYLDTDSASSLGNVEYMRTAKTVRRTFPKAAGSKEEIESIVQVSSMEAMRLSKYEAEAKSGSPQAETSSSADQGVPSTADTAKRRQADSSMDMFRSMAKEIRKN